MTMKAQEEAAKDLQRAIDGMSNVADSPLLIEAEQRAVIRMTMLLRKALGDPQEETSTDRDLLAAVDALRALNDSPRLIEAERNMADSVARLLESTVAPWLTEDRKAVA